MKHKTYFILFIFCIYACTFFFYGNHRLGLEIIENNSFHKNENTIHVQIYNLDDYQRNQIKIVSILNKKGFNSVNVNYAENYLNENNYSYWLEIQELAPFVNIAYDGLFKKDEISKEYEGLYIWGFFKWIKVYKKSKPKPMNQPQ